MYEVGFFLDRIVYYYIVGGRNNTLSGGLADQEEIISIGRNNVRVYNCSGQGSRQGVTESLSVFTFEESLIYTFVDKNDHDLNFIFRTNFLNGRLDLGKFVH